MLKTVWRKQCINISLFHFLKFFLKMNSASSLLGTPSGLELNPCLHKKTPISQGVVTLVSNSLSCCIPPWYKAQFLSIWYENQPMSQGTAKICYSLGGLFI